tara:strand:- start:523 stop:783 length:261 start_codon:yes stop_codon:yes gene_type:complete
MAIVNEKNVLFDGVSVSETGVSLSEMLVKVLKTMKDNGMISEEENNKTKIMNVVHRVICNRENEWGENDTEEKLRDEVLSTLKLVG